MKTYQQGLVAVLMLFAVSIACKKNCDIECLNGGNCNDGNCDCPDGYIGPDCGEQETPSDMYIHAVRVTKFPPLFNGGNWDGSPGIEPDIYFQLYFGGNLVYEQNSYYEDVESLEEYDLLIGDTIHLANVIGQHQIHLLDYDHEINPDDIMGVLVFVPYWSNTNGFPTMIEVEGTDLSFDLMVSYEW